MKTYFSHGAAAFSCLLISMMSIFGQGALTPPGAPGPTMKTLDQIEARTPLAGGTSPITISAAGSYYLTGNLSVASGDAITITAADVTLDLNGFLISTAPFSSAGSAILISSDKVTVGNGHIEGSFQRGVTSNSASHNGAHDLSVDGCSSSGISLASGSMVERCKVTYSLSGIVADTVRSCTVANSGGQAIQGVNVSDSDGTGGTGGIKATSANNSVGNANSGIGLQASNAQNCLGQSSSGTGLDAGTATACTGNSTQASGTGLNAVSATACTGSGFHGTGLTARTAASCQGSSYTGIGLIAFTASASDGTSDSNIGLQVNTGSECTGTTNSGPYGAYGNVFTGSQGFNTGNSGGGAGLYANNAATNSFGNSQTGYGLFAATATNCSGQTAAPVFAGLYAQGAANTCRGQSTAASNPIALSAAIAIGCTSAGGPISSPSKQLGTP